MREAIVQYRGRRQRVASPIREPHQAVELARRIVRDHAREHFLALYLDGRHRPIAHAVVSVGTATASLVHPREVFQTAVLTGAVALLVLHNHPSGDPAPSREDRGTLAQGGHPLGCPASGLDHLDPPTARSRLAPGGAARSVLVRRTHPARERAGRKHPAPRSPSERISRGPGAAYPRSPFRRSYGLLRPQVARHRPWSALSVTLPPFARRQLRPLHLALHGPLRRRTRTREGSPRLRGGESSRLSQDAAVGEHHAGDDRARGREPDRRPGPGR
ncbi:MAG: JAB domain-containing protein [Proteobacteria bacterium]|nr:JAB domain-containing protein [Pseudomonadota bacterium]